MSNFLSFGGRVISNNGPTFIIAELSANHGQDLKIAIETVRAAKKAGADCVKIQTYTPDTITLDCDNEYFQIKQGTVWDGQTLHALYKGAYTPWEWHAELQRVAREEGLEFFSSPFDPTAVDLLEELGVPGYKIASFEIHDLPLIEYVASKGKPVIISTGIATADEIEEALSACRRQGNDQLCLLKCTSSYPAPMSEMNLRTIPDMQARFGTLVGLSDHTVGTTAPTIAVTLGACVIEKHFIIDRKVGGPDATFSLEPSEFKAMVAIVREVEQGLGTVSYELSPKTLRSREFCRSLFVTQDVAAGEQLTKDNVRSIRPGFGLPPKHLPEVLGRTAQSAIRRGTPLSWAMMSPEKRSS